MTHSRLSRLLVLSMAMALAVPASAQTVRTETDGTIVIEEEGFEPAPVIQRVRLGPSRPVQASVPQVAAQVRLTPVQVPGTPPSAAPAAAGTATSVTAPAPVIAASAAPSPVTPPAETAVPAPELQAAAPKGPFRTTTKNLMGKSDALPAGLSMRFFAVPGENGQMKIGYNMINTSTSTILITDPGSLSITQGVRMVKASLNSTNSSGQAGYLAPRSGEYGMIELSDLAEGQLELRWKIVGSAGQDLEVVQRWDVLETPMMARAGVR